MGNAGIASARLGGPAPPLVSNPGPSLHVPGRWDEDSDKDEAVLEDGPKASIHTSTCSSTRVTSNPAPPLHVPDRWDEDSDEDEAVLQDGQKPSIQTSTSSSTVVESVPCTSAQPPEHVSDAAMRERCALHSEKAKSSGHGRLRKDLVNLNKTTAKWLAQEASGHLTRDESCRRISNS